MTPRTYTGLLTICLLAIAPLASSGHATFSDTDTLYLGTQFEVIEYTYQAPYAQIFGSCTTTAANGISGMVYELPGLDGHQATLSMDLTLNADLYFFDDACNELLFVGTPFPGGTESSTVPAGTHVVLVHAFAGAGGYTLTIT